MTVGAGLVDAFSYLELGRVSVVNMPGDVVFLSFALGGTSGFVWWASVLGVLTFMISAFVGGRIRTAHGAHRRRHVHRAAPGSFDVSPFRPRRAARPNPRRGRR
ncbi:DUF1275 family protein [Propionicicella superfundia]|uniref:DUF1275 family protein n=1 Tax=Propionicicella superfundia TaxID=348582 RepID=UPI001FE140AE|nr:DUF1275 family protein [Propionicicella superfundia]